MEKRFRKLRLSQLDRNLPGARNLLPRPKDGWLASTREALGLSLADLGSRIRLSKQGVQRFERAEATGQITLKNFRRLAEGMGCDLVYVLVPKSGSFAALEENSAREGATRDVKRVIQTMALEDQKPTNVKELIEDETQRRLKS
jgi:predicted DNA-binding mobile mystery protein A